jgi:hypothetical protein
MKRCEIVNKPETIACLSRIFAFYSCTPASYTDTFAGYARISVSYNEISIIAARLKVHAGERARGSIL